MSGPKLSEAEIERRRREQLERERLEALKRLREAQRAYREACDRAAGAKRYAQEQLGRLDAMYAGDAGREVRGILSSLVIRSVQDTKDPQAYHVLADSIRQDADRAAARIDACLGKYLLRTAADQKLSRADQAYQSFQAFLDIRNDPVDEKTLDFRSDYDWKRMLDQVQRVQNHYRRLAVSGDTEAMRRFAEKSADMIQRKLLGAQPRPDISRMASVVQSLLNEEADIRRREAEKQAAYEDYAALAAMLDVDPKPPGAFADAESVRMVVSEFQQKLREKDEMDYIADQINDVMVSLGYGFVTSRVLTRKDRSEMDFSLYQADGETGIAVYTDQTGAVMMRMTVLGDDGNISEEDRDFSLERQIDFCAGHADIVEALAQRGVYLKQKSYLPPDRKHTYKIDMSAAGDAVRKDADGRTVLRKEKIDRRKRRRADRKKVRAM